MDIRSQTLRSCQRLQLSGSNLADPARKGSPARLATDLSGSHVQPCVVIKGQVAANVPCGLQQQQPSAPAASLPLPPPWSTSFPSRPPCPCKPQHQLTHCKLASLPPAPRWSAVRLLPAFPLCKAQHQLLLRVVLSRHNHLMSKPCMLPK